jgi:hypothetical protein
VPTPLPYGLPGVALVLPRTGVHSTRRTPKVTALAGFSTIALGAPQPVGRRPFGRYPVHSHWTAGPAPKGDVVASLHGSGDEERQTERDLLESSGDERADRPHCVSGCQRVDHDLVGRRLETTDLQDRGGTRVACRSWRRCGRAGTGDRWVGAYDACSDRGVSVNKIGTLLQILHRNEHGVAKAMSDLANRHSDDHEICDVARELSRWSDRHLEQLRAIGSRYDIELGSDHGSDHARSVLDEADADLQRADPVDDGMLVLRELRSVHLACVGLSVDWEVLGQAAKALRDDDLEALAEGCQADAVRQMKWTNAKIKESAPQILVS